MELSRATPGIAGQASSTSCSPDNSARKGPLVWRRKGRWMGGVRDYWEDSGSRLKRRKGLFTGSFEEMCW